MIKLNKYDKAELAYKYGDGFSDIEYLEKLVNESKEVIEYTHRGNLVCVFGYMVDESFAYPWIIVDDSFTAIKLVKNEVIKSLLAIDRTGIKCRVYGYNKPDSYEKLLKTAGFIEIQSDVPCLKLWEL